MCWSWSGNKLASPEDGLASNPMQWFHWFDFDQEFWILCAGPWKTLCLSGFDKRFNWLRPAVPASHYCGETTNLCSNESFLPDLFVLQIYIESQKTLCLYFRFDKRFNCLPRPPVSAFRPYFCQPGWTSAESGENISSNVVQIICKHFANIVQTFCKQCANIVQTLCKCCANNAQILSSRVNIRRIWVQTKILHISFDASMNVDCITRSEFKNRLNQ